MMEYRALLLLLLLHHFVELFSLRPPIATASVTRTVVCKLLLGTHIVLDDAESIVSVSAQYRTTTAHKFLDHIL
jgi:hypothetical protein